MKNKKNTHKKNGFKKALKYAASITGVLVMSALIVAMLAGMVFEYMEPSETVAEQTDGSARIVKDKSEVDYDPTAKIETKLPPGENKINVAVFGVDVEGVRTDVIFVASFDKNTNRINVLSVPRDTKFTMPDDMVEDLEERGQYIPYIGSRKGQCKINEVHAYAGEGYRNEYSVRALEDLLGVKIDHYIKISTSAFRDIVDAIGGIDYDVPQRLYYSDPYQNLYINLYPGMQHLDGDKAEQLVRFRKGYAQQDITRISVQQDFMKELLKKITSADTILSNLPNIIKTLFDSVETNISLADAVSYAQYVNKIKMYNISMATIPGEAGNYFIADEKGVSRLADEYFYDNRNNPYDGLAPKKMDYSQNISIVTAERFMED